MSIMSAAFTNSPTVAAHHFAAMDEPGTLQSTLRAFPNALSRLPVPAFDLSQGSMTPAP